jgi:hypothetical protein
MAARSFAEQHQTFAYVDLPKELSLRNEAEFLEALRLATQ